MVDEYYHNSFFFLYFCLCSDSSMVDEYQLVHLSLLRLVQVQIPLWSMNTMVWFHYCRTVDRSDSSMVDEYAACSPPFPREEARSDSSMVDEYARYGKIG